MGVTYKMTDEVVRFIIDKKRADAALSCAGIAQEVEQSFHVHVSKSSVYDILKEAHVVIPKPRRPKDSFAIPSEKKSIIQENLLKAGVPFIAPPLPQPDDVIPLPTPKIIKQEEWFVEERSLGELLFEATCWHLYPYHILGIDRLEQIQQLQLHRPELVWQYLLKEAKAFKFQVDDGQVLSLPVCWPIERAVHVATQMILGQKRDFKITQNPQNVELKTYKLKKISIVDDKDRIYAEYETIVGENVYFELKNMEKVDLNEVVCQAKTGVLKEKPTVLGLDLKNVAQFTQEGQWFTKKAMSYAKERFGGDGLVERWEEILDLKAEGIENNIIRVVSIVFPDSYDIKSGLEKLLDHLNALELEDQFNKKVRFRLSS